MWVPKSVDLYLINVILRVAYARFVSLVSINGRCHRLVNPKYWVLSVIYLGKLCEIVRHEITKDLYHNICTLIIIVLGI